MTQATATLADFLLARIAEDEAAWSGGVGLATRPDFARLARHMLADCEAKRRIVDLYVKAAKFHQCTTDELFFGETLGLLALPYADHPAYRPEWRP